jgi:uncharacterized protein YcnI
VKIESVELLTPDAEASAEYQKTLPMPDGKNYKLPVTPTKRLVIKMKEGTGSSKSTLPVVEQAGKFLIPLPVPAA